MPTPAGWRQGRCPSHASFRRTCPRSADHVRARPTRFWRVVFDAPRPADAASPRRERDTLADAQTIKQPRDQCAVAMQVERLAVHLANGAVIDHAADRCTNRSVERHVSPLESCPARERTEPAPGAGVQPQSCTQLYSRPGRAALRDNRERPGRLAVFTTSAAQAAARDYAPAPSGAGAGNRHRLRRTALQAAGDSAATRAGRRRSRSQAARSCGRFVGFGQPARRTSVA